MSAGRDNSIRQWLFDNADGGARLLRFRAGHSAPPGCLSYYGDGSRLLSAGAFPPDRTGLATGFKRVDSHTVYRVTSNI